MGDKMLDTCSVASTDVPQPHGRHLKVALISSGLGTTNRGFEISAARWFEALKAHSNLDIRLFCGGDYAGGKKLWNFPRKSVWTAPFQFLPFCPEKTRWELCYGTEQISFWSALNWELLRWKPDAVWVKDIPLAHLLLGSRAILGLNFKIVLANGGMLRPKTYQPFDVIQQLSLQAYKEALEFGIPASKMQLISNCFPRFEVAKTRKELRNELGFNDNDWVLICVAAWNKYHKRIDYLLEEVARLDDPNVKLILCGAAEVDSDELRRLGTNLLGDRVKWMTVAPNVVPELLHASDVFVLPSMRESLGNALVEAALCGLPVVTHPHDGARYALQDKFWMVDMSEPGNLSAKLQQFKNDPPNAERLRQLQSDVSSRFSDRVLAPQFEQMVADACVK